jgi:hypothetical protein
MRLPQWGGRRFGIFWRADELLLLMKTGDWEHLGYKIVGYQIYSPGE